MEDLCSDEQMKNLKRKVGSFTVRGITGTDELETLQVCTNKMLDIDMEFSKC